MSLDLVYPVFTYWDDDKADVIAAQVEACRASFANYSILTRKAARALLYTRSPAHLEAFDGIAIPACRSDIARLLGLWRSGGLYIDAHCRIDDASEVMRWMAMLKQWDMVVSTRYAPNFSQVMPHNSIIWSRPNGATVSRLLDLALENLAQKYARERAVGFEPYHVWDITGPGVFWREIFDVAAADGRLLPNYAGCVAIVHETDNPITRHIYMGYRGYGRHWSERQTCERLFG